MPIPKRVASFNKHVTNRITRHVAAWMPMFGIITHTGRRSGRTYATPLNVFTKGTRYVFALTYGSDTDWVKNVIAAGGCTIKTRSRMVQLRDPKLFRDPERRDIPIVVRWALGLISV